MVKWKESLREVVENRESVFIKGVSTYSYLHKDLLISNKWKVTVIALTKGAIHNLCELAWNSKSTQDIGFLALESLEAKIAAHCQCCSESVGSAAPVPAQH